MKKFLIMRIALFTGLSILCAGCFKREHRFHLVADRHSGIRFSNDLKESDSLNALTFEYIYNGGGVATADFNNDGLLDSQETGGCNASDKSAGTRCNTAPCPVTGECTLTWGYWKTHGPDPDCSPGNQENKWGVASLNIGGLSLDQGQLCDILHVNPGACNKQGQGNGGSNAVIILEHQLIAAMLNVANGAINCSFVGTAITQANAALTGHVYDCIGTSTPDGQNMVALASLLESYNSDNCSCPTASPLQNSANAPAPTTKATWGQVKSHYR